MSRTMFILGCALLAVAGSLVFVLSHGDEPAPPVATKASLSEPRRFHERAGGNWQDEGSRARAPRVSQRDEEARRVDVAIEPARLARLTPGDRARAAALVDRVERESLDRLDRLDAEYGLTPAQRDEIYPLVVAHHPLAHPALRISGEPIPALGHPSNLEESLFPYLEEEQKQQVADEAIDRMNWWTEIIGQIEDDLDRSLDQGGDAAWDPDALLPAVGGPPTDAGGGVGFDTDEPAAGDGESSSHGGGNLFDLLGR